MLFPTQRPPFLCGNVFYLLKLLRPKDKTVKTIPSRYEYIVLKQYLFLYFEDIKLTNSSRWQIPNYIMEDSLTEFYSSEF